MSPWLTALQGELQRSRKHLAEQRFAGVNIRVELGSDTLWALVNWGKGGGGLALRLAYAPGGLELKEDPREAPFSSYTLACTFGELRVDLCLPDASKPLLRWRTQLTPSVDLTMPFWPRDLVPIDAKDNPLKTRGIVFATQRGPKAALLYASLVRPDSGAFLYLQDLTSLNDYCDCTQTQPFGRVGGEWPELGWALPTSYEHPLPAGESICISDAILHLTPQQPQDHQQAAGVFLDLFADAYLQVQRPPTSYHNWLERAEASLHDLEASDDCTTSRRGLRYFNAYVGSGKLPPESMVQLAVLLPILDYFDRQHKAGRDVPLVKEIRQNLGSFFNTSIGALVRYLPGDPFPPDRQITAKDNHHVMDAWYLYHTLYNTGRLALRGDEDARRLFLASLPFAEKVAHHFNYRWPIFYDMNTLEPVLSESETGYGETDVAGLYASVMLHARDLTGDSRYRREAEAAVETLTDYGFRLAYQFNSTIYAAVALIRLWSETRRKLYRELSEVCMANFLRDCWLWECRYGHGEVFPTFFGLPPMHDGVYIAVFEESESLAAMGEYLKIAGDEAHPALRMLLPEYTRYLLHRAWYTYPSELPAKILAKDPADGHLDRKLAVPLEDLGDGWRNPGQIGQEVYGAGAAFIFASRAYRIIDEGGFRLFSDTNTANLKASGTPRKGRARFDVLGDPRLTTTLRFIPLDKRLPPGLTIRLSGRREALPTRRDGRELEVPLPSGSRVQIAWGE